MRGPGATPASDHLESVSSDLYRSQCVSLVARGV